MTPLNDNDSGSVKQGERSMTQSPRVSWPDDRADLAGSPRNLQTRLAGCQPGSLRQQESAQRETQPDSMVSAGGTANQDESTTAAIAPGPRSSRTLWADQWQR